MMNGNCAGSLSAFKLFVIGYGQTGFRIVIGKMTILAAIVGQGWFVDGDCFAIALRHDNGRAGYSLGILGPTETLVAFQGGSGEAARKMLLLNGQHVDGVSPAFSNVWQRLTVEINTYQDQRWIEGD